ncbi:DNA alkylation repair protein [Bacteroidota bacterium]
MDKTVNTVIYRLKQRRNSVRVKQSETYYPTALRVLGVKVPDQREIVRWLRKEVKNWLPRDIIDLSIKLVETGIYECQQVAYELLGKSNKLVGGLTREDLTALATGLDNWASVDAYSIYLYGIKWRQGIISDNDVLDLAESDNRWERRVAIVSTVALNQKAHGGMGDADRTLMICEKVIDDRDDMVVKALSWALRELAKREDQPVRKFMEENDSRLAGRVCREVWNKLNTGKKN